MTAAVVINGVDMPAPSSKQIKYADTGNSRQNELGQTQFDVIRLGQATITCGWTNITNKELSTLLKAVKTPGFSITYYDSELMERRTIVANAGDRSPQTVLTPMGTRYNISFDIVEL